MTVPRARAAALLGALALSACSAFSPERHEGAAFRLRVALEESDGFRVKTAALSRDEARRYVGVDTWEHGIQPIWIEIENRTDRTAWYLPIGTDPAYFAPNEVAWRFHRWFDSGHDRRVDAHLLATSMPVELPPGKTSSGFVYTHAGEGARYVRVQVVDGRDLLEFRFVDEVPGGKWDFQRVNFSRLYPAAQVRDLDLPALLAEIEKLPCCAADAKGAPVADPLNVVIVGAAREVAFPLVQRGWNLTDPLDVGSAWRSVKAFLFGSPYETSPVSPLHLFGRPQDAALQKPRGDIDRRNHMRLWLAPFTFQGKPVWVGQVSRDIGVRFTTHSWYLTTHKIDPDVDEDRDYLLQDAVMSGYVGRVAMATGVGAATQAAPRHNMTGDPYFTDGQRVVLFMDETPRPIHQVEIDDRVLQPTDRGASP